MKKINIITLIMGLLVFSCNTDATTNNVVSEESIQLIIEDLKKGDGIDKEKVSELIKSIDAFAKDNAKDKNTPKHLELKAKYLGALGKNKEALEVYNTIYSKYKNSENGSDALFMMAFLYENNMGNKEKAKEFYQKYLDEFPTKAFAKDAKFSIENIDKTPEELMEMWNKNKEK